MFEFRKYQFLKFEILFCPNLGYISCIYGITKNNLDVVDSMMYIYEEASCSSHPKTKHAHQFYYFIITLNLFTLNYHNLIFIIFN